MLMEARLRPKELKPATQTPHPQSAIARNGANQLVRDGDQILCTVGVYPLSRTQDKGRNGVYDFDLPVGRAKYQLALWEGTGTGNITERQFSYRRPLALHILPQGPI